MEDNQNDMTDTESEDLFNLKENNLAVLLKNFFSSLFFILL